jgi:hypothetical protein
LIQAIRSAVRSDVPFRHWLLREVLPTNLANELIALPFAAPCVADTEGKRETNNNLRRFITPTERNIDSTCETLAEALQDRFTTDLLAETCGRSLAGSYLRIEYCLDTDGFWLEPHTDIAAKLFTMLIYLSTHPDAEQWGTDLLDANHRLAGRSSGEFNTGLIFLPASDTWHGFARRPIAGLRRSLIVNYVTPDWRSRHELAFPDQPIG